MRRRPGLVLVAAAVFSSLPSCGSARPDTIPFRGPTPQSILVVPTARTSDLSRPDDLDTAFIMMLRERGFTTPGYDDSERWLDALDWTAMQNRVEELPLSTLREIRGIEAVWVTEVVRWKLEDGPGKPLDFSLTCSVFDTADPRIVWRCHLEGRQTTVGSRTVINPLADTSPFESDHPFFFERVDEGLDDRSLSELVAGAFGLRLP